LCIVNDCIVSSCESQFQSFSLGVRYDTATTLPLTSAMRDALMSDSPNQAPAAMRPTSAIPPELAPYFPPPATFRDREEEEDEEDPFVFFLPSGARAAVPPRALIGAGRLDLEDAASIEWRERERRQSSLRTLLMVLLLLLLMDGDDNERRRNSQHFLRRNGGSTSSGYSTYPVKSIDTSMGTSSAILEPAVYASRRAQDERIRRLVTADRRYDTLRHQYNHGQDYDQMILKWATARAEQERDQFTNSVLIHGDREDEDPNEESFLASAVFHYPWNSTGLYHGSWTRATSDHSTQRSRPQNNASSVYLDAVSLEEPLQSMIQDQTDEAERLLRQSQAIKQPSNVATTKMESISWWQRQVQYWGFSTASLSAGAANAKSDEPPAWIPHEPPRVGVFLLPPKHHIIQRDDHNLTSSGWNEKVVDTHGRLYEAVNLSPPHGVPYLIPSSSIALPTTATVPTARRDASSDHSSWPLSPPPQDDAASPGFDHVTLKAQRGRIAMQLYSRGIPAIHELSLVDGIIKIYDSVGLGFSSPRDLVIRVRGVSENVGFGADPSHHELI
jgi:hypothetical protein